MAKRQKKKLVKQKLERIKTKQNANRPQEQLKSAVAHFNQGKFTDALLLAEEVHRKSESPEIDAKATKIAVEALFRNAAQTSDPAKRLKLLADAANYNPADARLQYHIGLTHLRLGKLNAAAKTFEALAKLAPNHPQLPYIQALIQAGQGKAVKGQQSTDKQQATVDLISGIQKGSNADVLQLLLQKAQLRQPDQWAALTKMASSRTSAPLEALAPQSHSTPGKEHPIIGYYHGVAAMRKKENEQARQRWTVLQGLGTPWFNENLGGTQQEEVSALATAGAWDRIMADYGDLMTSPQATGNKALSEILGTAFFYAGYQAAQAQQWQNAASGWEAAGQFANSRLLLQNIALVHEAMGEWETAANSWREMIKRRPRKEDHPDYLTDDQVAAIWARAATDYGFAELYEEAITCIKNAIKYDEANVQLRMVLVSLFMQEERVDSAINELNRILEIDKDNLEALKHLAMLYSYDSWRHDVEGTWQRVLEIDPTDRDARDALAEIYIRQVHELAFYHYGGRKKRSPVEILEEGLAKLPNHPKLLCALGNVYMETVKGQKKATIAFKQAWQAAPQDLNITSEVIQNLLLLEEYGFVEEMIPQVQKTTRAPAGFWLDQGETALENEIEFSWVERLWEQAYSVSQSGKDEYSPLLTLLIMFDEALDAEEDAFAAKIEKRVLAEAPNSGVEEYMKAHRVALEGDVDRALTLLQRAKSKLRKRKDSALLERIEEVEFKMSGPPPGLFNLFDKMGLNPMGPPPSVAELMDILEDLDEDTLDEFTRFMGD